jgi:hypothetical protein
MQDVNDEVAECRDWESGCGVIVDGGQPPAEALGVWPVVGVEAHELAVEGDVTAAQRVAERRELREPPCAVAVWPRSQTPGTVVGA